MNGSQVERAAVNDTLIAMSGSIRGSFDSIAMRTRTVAFSRLAVGTIAMTRAGIDQSG